MTNKGKTIFSALRTGLFGLSLVAGAAAVSTPAMAALTSVEQAQSAALTVTLVAAIRAAQAQATAQHLSGDAQSAAIQIAIVTALQGDTAASPAVREAALHAAQNELLASGELNPNTLAAITLVENTIAPVTPTSTSASTNASSVVGAPPAAGGASGGSDYRTP